MPLILLGGCNAIFGLDPTGGGDDDRDGGGDDVVDLDAPAIVHDEDNDGIDDAYDNCPSTPNPDQKNDDADLVGTDCDPNANADGDVILHFESFADDSGFDSWSPQRGTWEIAGDSLRQTDNSVSSGLAVATYDLAQWTDVTVEVVLEVVSQMPWNDVDPSAPRGAGVWFATSGGNGVDEPDGYLCQALNDLAVGTASFSLWRNEAGWFQLDSQEFQASLPTGTEGRIRAARLPIGVGTQVCTASLGGDALSTVQSNDATFVAGAAGLRSIWASVRFHSVTIYARSD